MPEKATVKWLAVEVRLGILSHQPPSLRTPVQPEIFRVQTHQVSPTSVALLIRFALPSALFSLPVLGYCIQISTSHVFCFYRLFARLPQQCVSSCGVTSFIHPVPSGERLLIEQLSFFIPHSSPLAVRNLKNAA